MNILQSLCNVHKSLLEVVNDLKMRKNEVMELDNLHFDFSQIDGYNKAFNMVISEREDGKTTAFHVRKAKPAFLAGRPTILLRRQQVDITSAYIDSIERLQNKFAPEGKKYHFSYKRGEMKEGVCNIYCDEKLAYVVVAISTPLSRIKSLMVENPAYFFFDEFICNNRAGEKYLSDEAFKIMEIYNTFYREGVTAPKFYATANPYSLYNPLFVYFGVDPKALVERKIVSGVNFAAQFHDLKPELKEFILARNPLYKFENAYTRYALKGQAINDENIKVWPKVPANYKLDFVIAAEGKFLGVYYNSNYGNYENSYYVGYVDNVGSRRNIYCFDFKDLVARSVLFSSEDRRRFQLFKSSVRSRMVAYQSLECDYLVEEIYNSL